MKPVKLKEYFGVNVEFSEPEDVLMKVQALLLAEDLSGQEIETLQKAWSDGLMESGDTPCKGARGSLLRKGILCQTCHARCDYTFSVTYPLGYQVHQALQVSIATIEVTNG